jgi:2-polyprenyl-3-methyl-5-hydroxy-6-metoxy-1,4-benzoquinol methylase
MRTTSQQPASATERVRRHFRDKASSFDHLYDDRHPLQRLLRPTLFHRSDLATSVVASLENPRVLDVGCGSGRIGQRVLDAGAARYVGIDFSEPMLELARERLAQYEPRVELVYGDFRTQELDGPFEVVLALGFFDYIADPEAYVRRIFDLCSGTAVASFPRWSLVKGPIRKLRYEVLNDCPIFDYTRLQLEALFQESGFSKVEVIGSGRSGLLVKADR